MGSKLIVADNSGAKLVECIKVLGGSKKSFGSIGDKIVACVKIAKPFGKVLKHDVVNAVIIRVKKTIKCVDGFFVKFSDNAVVLINDQDQLIGTRIIGPISRQIKYTKFSKLLTSATEVL